ncbi:MAG TPA: DUF4406 domain-containing protein [Bacteroidales bacterium]|nr:DUF4406 domain-containing protein [Bacteroidales bacterium]
MKTFISGQIETPSEDIRLKFQKAEDYLKSIGRFPLNPLKMPQENRFYHLQSCKSIYLLDSWIHSPEAMAEKYYSELTGKEIIYESNARNQEKINLKILKITEVIKEVAGWEPEQYLSHEKGPKGLKSQNRGYLGRLLFAVESLDAGMDLDEVCKYVGRDKTTVMCYPQKYENEFRFNARFRKIAEKVDKLLN